MAIIVDLDVMLARRKMRLNDLSERVGVSPQNLSILKTGKAKAIRFSTLDAICVALECEPGDILRHQPNAMEN
jgi:putative transcriptional regulator